MLHNAITDKGPGIDQRKEVRVFILKNMGSVHNGNIEIGIKPAIDEHLIILYLCNCVSCEN